MRTGEGGQGPGEFIRRALFLDRFHPLPVLELRHVVLPLRNVEKRDHPERPLRQLLVVGLRDDDADQAPVLIVEAARSGT